jgi:uncharacterized protein
MTQHRRWWWATVAAATLVVLPACGDDDNEPTNTVSTGIANPASEYCIEQGGTVEIVEDAGGEIGYCNLPDGTRIEEWEYYRSQTGVTSRP